MGRLTAFRAAALILGSAFLLPAHAATVEVLVRERGAGPMADQWVCLQSKPDPGEVSWPWERNRIPPAATSMNGKVVFNRVPVGRYLVGLERITDPGLVNPAANPDAPPQQITIAKDDDKISVEIEVWRGTLLSTDIVMDRPEIPRGTKLIVRSLDGEPDSVIQLAPLGHADRLLLPGRYELELVFPPGYLLIDIVWNGESLPGHVVRFDVREDPRKQSVSWYLSALCLVTGSIDDGSGHCDGQVVATLVEPGPWLQAALQRGGSSVQSVPDQERFDHDPCRYKLWLPEGHWTVQLVGGDDILSSDPANADVVIASGETRTLDFKIQLKDGDRERRYPLYVAVRSPEGKPLGGAIVEVWPPDGNSASRGPLKSEKTEDYGGSVAIRGLAAGSYLVAAGREEFLDDTAKVEDYNPKSSEPKRVTLTLKEGAKLHGHAVDEKDRAVKGVELKYTRVSPLPKMTLANEGIVAKKRGGSALTDVTGHAEVLGLYSGDYHVEAHMTGEQSATHFVVVRQGKNARSVDLTLTEGQRSDLELLVLPAASISGHAVCSDRGTMPTRMSFRLFPASSPMDGLWSDKDLAKGATIAADDVVLRGTRADEFHIGPLPAGEYWLAARPEGQKYWSWVLNELVPDRAAVFPALETSAVDAGAAEIECGPIVAVVPTLRSKEAVPDMRLGTGKASLRLASEEKNPRRVSADVEQQADRVFLRRLPEGKFKASMTVMHPYLIPSSILVPEQAFDFTRGSFVEVGVVFEKLGGMVEVRGGGTTARLTPGEGASVLVPLENGKADFRGTPAGTYRVELCARPDCATATMTWKDVVVEAGRTTFRP